MDFNRLVGELVTVTTVDGKHTTGVVNGMDDEGWLFVQVYTRTVAIDTMAVVSVTIPAGYLGKGLVKDD